MGFTTSTGNPTRNYKLSLDLRLSSCQPVQNANGLATSPHSSRTNGLGGSSFFASNYFCAGYCQMPLHADNQKYLSFLTPSGVFQPTRTLQGPMNLVQDFHSRMEPCFMSIRNSVKEWHDEFSVHSMTEDGLLSNIHFLSPNMWRQQRNVNLPNAQQRWILDDAATPS